MPDYQWCMITPEYFPALPNQAGMGDGARHMACGLAKRGHEVLVLAPDGPKAPSDPGVIVERVLGHFSPIGWWRASKRLGKIVCKRRLFLQWVPHGYGYKSCNLFLVIWLVWRVTIRRDVLYVMVHEPFLMFEGNLRQRMAACIHRLMVYIILRLTTKTYAGNKKWIEYLDFWKPRKMEIAWLPVFSNVSLNKNNCEVVNLKKALAKTDNMLVLGHFGTYGAHTRIFLEPTFSGLLKKTSEFVLLLLGRGSKSYLDEFIGKYPQFRNRIVAAGNLSQEELSLYLQSCDLMVQPYFGGLSTRNGSLMALLLHSLPVVGNHGYATDKEWFEWNAIALVPEGDTLSMVEKCVELLNLPDERKRLSERGYKLYEEKFSLGATIDALLMN